MSDEVEGPSKTRLKDAYKGDLNVSKSSLEDDVDFRGPFGVIDPRLIGYSYVSYALINSGSNLVKGFGAERGIFDHEQLALMLGSALGEYDFIHRRVDSGTHQHANFSVNAIDDADEDLAFIQHIETYPIFTIGRWHGMDIPVQNMTLRDDAALDPLDDHRAEILYEWIHNPELEPERLIDNIRARIADDTPTLFDDYDEETYNNGVEKFDSNFGTSRAINSEVNNVKRRFRLGKSVEVNVPSMTSIDMDHVLVGISVEQGVDINNDGEFDLPNEKVMSNLQDEFDRWQMPYIVSGVGKAWGDILVEMHINKIEDMETYAESLRDVDGVDTTKTFAITNTSFNSPFIPDLPKDILIRESLVNG